jgi:glucosylceramidase
MSSASRPTRRSLLQLAASSTACLALPSTLKAQFAPSPLVLPPGLSADCIATTADAAWQPQHLFNPGWHWDALDAQIFTTPTQKPIEGFGGCFNEFGWTSLAKLTPDDREEILNELFLPGKGLNFNICRMPIGANDYSRSWYSYDETPGDFALTHFSIDNDRETLIPFIQAAKRRNPKLSLWASPWSPPSWMKTNNFYAEAEPFPGYGANGITKDQIRHEGEDVFIQQDAYFDAYARYFGRFIDAYREQGIDVGMVMPQNEFNSAQWFPSCTWTPEGLARFIRHLGPEMATRHVEIFFGTDERGDPKLFDRVMADPTAASYIKGIGTQWAGKNAVASIHRNYPDLAIYQSEQECGDGKNEWSYAAYTWDLMKHYFHSGATAYMYWQISALTNGTSHWGWNQNSLITVDIGPDVNKFHYNPDFYFFKHLSHFVQPGARLLATTGTHDDLLAFANPDKSTIVLLRNEAAHQRIVNVDVAGTTIPVVMPPDSISTLVVKQA